MEEEDGYVVQYPHTSATRFYACRQCRTHIAFSPDCIYRRYDRLIIFKNAVNLWTDNTPEYYTFSAFLTFASVNCMGCNMELGKEIIQVDYPQDFLQRYVGNVEIPPSKLLFWNGNEMVEEDGYVDQPQTPCTRFYACRVCSTPIGVPPNVLNIYGENITFKNAVNLRTTPENQSVTLAKTSCRGCNMVLGTEIFEARYPDIAVHQESIGHVEIPLSKLRFWNGNKMVEAVLAEERPRYFKGLFKNFNKHAYFLVLPILILSNCLWFAYLRT